MLDNLRDRIRIVLVATSHPGNIGAAARAMKTMGLGDLALVRPAHFPDAEASARASGAADLLASARVTADLPAAIADCGFVVGASARMRALAWPTMNPRDCATRLVAESAAGRVALLFGTERSGLSNEELAHCHALVNIPANPDYSSLNLAMAVQVLCYELRMAALGTPPAPDVPRERRLATGGEMEGFYGHLESVLRDIRYLNPAQPHTLLLRLRRLFNRAELDDNEVNILRGVLAAVEAAVHAPGR